ncbi:Protein YOP1 [Mycena sanguinolenta]|uniref:Protein YOP1 n=1 Tax=Mycena sanguinolenta TaxID=230812 RepID=A0A8H6YUA6_9AGAR|nr:Protein YOP1 [Mycena sanguinolenta]
MAEGAILTCVNNLTHWDVLWRAINGGGWAGNCGRDDRAIKTPYTPETLINSRLRQHAYPIPLALASSAAAFLYLGYASYDTFSKRPASEEDLERWLMYCPSEYVVKAECVAEWTISLYYLLKTLFLLYFALRRTRGLTYIYSLQQTFFRGHEVQNDSRLAQLRAHFYTFLQQLQLLTLGRRWSGSKPSSSVVGKLWRSYGPGIMASAAVFLRPPTPAPARQQVNLNSSAAFPESTASIFSHGSADATQSILERRRALRDQQPRAPHVHASPHAAPGPALALLALPALAPSAPLTPNASP